jgi:uncharacterized membrane protein
MQMRSSLVLAILLVASFAKAQSHSEFAITLSETSVVLKPGESKKLIVSISRFKGFTRGDIQLGLSSILPEGITVAYEPAGGKFDTSAATISASPTARIGEYRLILNGTIQYKTKGTSMKVIVSNDSAAK